MIELFKEIILEKQLEDLSPDYTSRSLEYSIIKHKALSIIGPRRSGKTFFLKQISEDIIRSKKLSFESGQLVYINLFDERILPLDVKQLGVLLNAHQELYSDLTGNSEVHFFLDEIQLVPGWELFVSRLIRQSGFQVYISGSSSNMLSKEIATSMRGRSISVELFPFSFQEFLHYHKVQYHHVAGRKKARVIRYFKQYMLEGGFPETFLDHEITRRQILQEYYHVMIYKDIIERHNYDNPLAVLCCLKLLMNQIGGLYSVNKLYEKIKSQGYKISKGEVSEFLSWFEDIYLLFTVPIFSDSETKRQVNPKKIYCIDNGLVNAVANPIWDNSAHLLENLVFTHLRRSTLKIYYYKNAQGREVDFVTTNYRDQLQLIQVCTTLFNEEVLKREVEGLDSAMQEYGVRSGYIITLGERQVIKSKYGTIHIIPAWDFCLE